MNECKQINPLQKPLIHGWQRQRPLASRSINMNRKSIVYVAPCGRCIRSTNELESYLEMTDSKLTIDMFTFDSFIRVDREFESTTFSLKIEDLTNGHENMQISCVNNVDDELPDIMSEHFTYSSMSVPLEGVPLNRDPSLLHGCNCEGNCRENMHCSCWHKTYEATRFSMQCDDSESNFNIGYRRRRLNERAWSAIFECNANCKCDARCSNRVVQNGIQVRLQLFKTSNKGWGLRCVDDIPKGIN